MIRSFILIAGLLSITGALAAQPKGWKRTAREFQSELSAGYRDSAESPLTDSARRVFTRHDFFPVNKKYVIMAAFTRTPDEKPFDMLTSSGKTKPFVKYGEIRFELDGQECLLNVYQNLKYPEDLFLPFKDLTTGEETYGAGRYMDLPIPTGNTLLVDFNQCYNPYCAYRTGWNCPIVPTENILKVAIRAGVRGNRGTAFTADH